MKTKEEIISAIATDNAYESWSEFMNDSHEHTQMDATLEAMQTFADQETAPLKIENGRMSDTINALIRSGSEKDTEISRLKQRLADCERKRLTGERI